jgi:hypothetical protein
MSLSAAWDPQLYIKALRHAVQICLSHIPSRSSDRPPRLSTTRTRDGSSDRLASDRTKEDHDRNGPACRVVDDTEQQKQADGTAA